MIQLNILSGKTAGAQLAARRFPFRIGRAEGNDLKLEDDGVWERHLVLEFQKGEGFKLATSANALATVNGEPVLEKILHNGDIITIGSARLQFWLAVAQQRGLGLRENFAWALLIFVTLGQFILIFWLLR
jgi:pSer/pThr/pTyr-binding forkhead associated (FHA) protein